MLRMTDANDVGKDLGYLFLKFKRYPLPKKILTFTYIFLCFGLPYYFLFYVLTRKPNQNLLRN